MKPNLSYRSFDKGRFATKIKCPLNFALPLLSYGGLQLPLAKKSKNARQRAFKFVGFYPPFTLSRLRRNKKPTVSDIRRLAEQISLCSLYPLQESNLLNTLCKNGA